MIPPRLLIDAVRDQWRGLSDFVVQLGGNPSRINGYYGNGAVNLADLLAGLPASSAVIFWTSSDPGRLGQNEVRVHHMGAYIKAGARIVDADIGIQSNLIDMVPILMGTGPESTDRFGQRELLPGMCYPPNEPHIGITPDGQSVDFLEIIFDVVEIGDQ